MREINFRGKDINYRRVGLWILLRARYLQCRNQENRKKLTNTSRRTNSRR